jgi:carbon storage regulator
VGEWIDIGQDIRVFITAIDRNQVKVGIEAPQNVVILRGELADRDEGEYE